MLDEKQVPEMEDGDEDAADAQDEAILRELGDADTMEGTDEGDSGQAEVPLADDEASDEKATG